MIYIYSSILSILCIILIVFYIYLFQKLKYKHKSEIKTSQLVIDELKQIQNKQKETIFLSEQSEIKLQSSRLNIDKELIDLQNELVSKLISNKLID